MLPPEYVPIPARVLGTVAHGSEDHSLSSPKAAGMRRLGRDTLIYGLGVTLSRAASFIMLPVYTHYLTPADYGIVQLLEMTLEVVAIVLSGGLAAGIYRFYFKAESPRERLRVFSTTLALTSASKLVGSAALLVTAPYVAGVLLDGAEHAVLVRIAAVTFLLQEFTTIPLMLLQIQQRAVAFIAVSVSRLVLQLSLNIFLLVVLGMGIQGILLGSLITAVVGGTGLTIWLLRQAPPLPTRKLALELIRFGLPYKLANVGTFLITFGDRFFLKASHGLAAVGLYGLGYQFAFAYAGLAADPFFRAWDPQRFALANEPKETRDKLYNRGLLVLNILFVTGAVVVSVFVYPLLQVMSPPEFYPAGAVVPLLLGSMVVANWIHVVEIGLQVTERSKYVTYSTWFGVAVVITFYALLIPTFGAIGAAVATLISSLARFSTHLYWSQKLWPVAYRWSVHLRLTGFAVGSVLAYTLLEPLVRGHFWNLVMLGAAALGLYLLLAWNGGIVSREDRAMLVGQLRERLKTLQTSTA